MQLRLQALNEGDEACLHSSEDVTRQSDVIVLQGFPAASVVFLLKWVTSDCVAARIV